MRDILFIITTLLIISFTVLIGYYFLVKFSEVQVFQDIPEVNNTVLPRGKTMLSSTFDTGFLVIFVALVISSMILGTLLPTRPIFFVPFIFVLILTAIIVAQVSNIYEQFETNAEIAGIISNFIYIPFVMKNLPILTLGLSVLLGIVVYGSYRKNQIIGG